MKIEKILADIKTRYDARKITGYSKGGKYAGHRYTKKNEESGSHGNTRLPYGIAKSEGIDTEGLTPREVWDKLKGEGYDPKEEYRKLSGKNNNSVWSGREDSEIAEAIKEKESLESSLRRTKNYIAAKEGHISYLKEEGDRQEALEKWYKSLKRGQWKTFEKGSKELNDYEECKEILAAVKKKTGTPGFRTEKYRESEKNEKEELEKLKNEAKETEEKISRMDGLKEEINRRYPTFESCLKSGVHAARMVDAKLNMDETFSEKSHIELDLKNMGWFDEEGGMKNITKSLDSLSSMFNKYPQLKGKLGPPTIKYLGIGVYAQSVGKDRVDLGEGFFRSEKKLKERLEKDEAEGFHPPGTSKDIGSVILHEYGHQIDFLLVERKNYRDEYLSERIAEAAKKKFWINPDETLCAKVSKYAEAGLTKYKLNQRYMEFMAECWSEYLTSESPREMAVFVGHEIEKAIKEKFG